MNNSTMREDTLLYSLLHNLKEAKVSFCHWKSNWKVDEAINEGEEIDLLVNETSVNAFDSILAELGFRLALLPEWASTPSIAHYYGYEKSTGQLLHVHVYYRLITGGALLKNFALPLESLVFDNLKFELAIPTVDKEIELGIFLLRKVLEHGSLPELALVLREWKDIQDEYSWLSEGKSPDAKRLLELFNNYLPELKLSDWQSMIDALEDKPSQPVLQRVVTAKKIRWRLKYYARISTLLAIPNVWTRFALTLRQRFWRNRRSHHLVRGGSIIAIVGPEATGKSTLLGETKSLLSENFEVFQLHAGQPASTLLTWIPNSIMPLLRKLLHAFRSGEIENDLQSNEQSESKPTAGLRMYAFALRSLMIAYDRRAALRKAYANSRQGAFVLCDRYPSPKPGAMDSGQLLTDYPAIKSSSLLQFAAKIEQRLYQQIPSPDLVVQLSVPVEVALERNRLRKKRGKEGDDYVIRRHKQALLQTYPKSIVHKIDTSTSLEQSILNVKSVVWDSI